MADSCVRQQGEAVCVLASGGLDSGVLIDELAPAYGLLQPVYVRCGLFWEQAERYWLRRFLKKMQGLHRHIRPLKILSMDLREIYGDHWSLTGENVPPYDSDDFEVYLPGRNIILLAKTAVYCVLHGITTIATAPLGANPFPDGTPGFYRHMQEVLSEGLDRRLCVRTPFRQLSKVEVIRMGRALPLELTFSCISPRGHLHCGECNKCAERIKAFHAAGVKDRTAYHVRPTVYATAAEGSRTGIRQGG
jgi:7-cyano-7-deazaguanine synthase